MLNGFGGELLVLPGYYPLDVASMTGKTLAAN
jgi:hypothetical protein